MECGEEGDGLWERMEEVGRMNRMEKDLVGWMKKDLVVRMKRIADGEGSGGEDEEDGGGFGGEDEEDGGGSGGEDEEDGGGVGREDEEEGGGPGGEDGGGSRREDGEEPEEEGVVCVVKYGAKQTTTTMNYYNYQCTVFSGHFFKVATKEYTSS